MSTAQRLNTVIILRNDSSANWLTNEAAVLARGEVALEYLDSGKVKMKIGDGTTSWKNLAYFGGEASGADEAIAELEAQVGKLNTDILGLLTRTEAIETKLENVYTKTEIDTLISTIYRVKGSVDSYNDLPTDAKVGDVYNIIYADFDYGINAGDNVVWNGEDWDRLGGTVDLTNYTTKSAFDALNAAVRKIAYEITSAPKNTLVDYDREKEIRVMCPKDTAWQLQNSGENADASTYYIGFKAYAPEAAVSFKEDLAEIITDNTMYYFENNDFAGVDQYGRKYSIVWLPVARYDASTQTWTYYGSMSTTSKFIGWFYSVEWYNAQGERIGADTIRINLSNEDCHTFIEPYYLGSINVNKLVQTEGEDFIINGGTSVI